MRSFVPECADRSELANMRLRPTGYVEQTFGARLVRTVGEVDPGEE
jgi:hypothetical protein